MKAPAKYMNVNVNACGFVAYLLTIVISLQDKESMMQVLRTVDKANGYCFGDLEERNLQVMMSAAVGADFQFSTYPSHKLCSINSCSHNHERLSLTIYFRTLGVQEKYVEAAGKTVEDEVMDL